MLFHSINNRYVEQTTLEEAIMGEYNAFALRRPYGFLLILFRSILSW